MKVQVSQAFRAISQADAKRALKGRTLCTGTFYTGGAWQVWFPHNGRLEALEDEFPAQGIYFGDTAESPHDLDMGAIGLIGQSASFADVRRPFVGVCDAIYNLSASIAKLNQLMTYQDVRGEQTTHMVIAEVKYMAIQCRSVFDSTHNMLRFVWSEMPATKDEFKRDLPESLSDMVLEKGVPRTAQKIVTCYGIPMTLALVYAKYTLLFAEIKRLRDILKHKSRRPLPIVVLENGAYIHHTIRPFASIATWRSEEIESGDLIPLRPALGAMIHRTLLAAQELVSTYFLLAFVQPIFRHHRLYLRSPFGSVLAAALIDAARRYDTYHSVESAPSA